MTRYALLLLLMLPAACAAPGPQDRAPEGVPVATPEPAQETKSRQHQPDINLLPPDQARRAELTTGKALKPEHLIGLHDSDLEKILGMPDFKRKDPPAQRWQYRNPSCLFDVFLYQEKNDADAYSVAHVEARGLDVNRVSDRDCFLSILKDRKPG